MANGTTWLRVKIKIARKHNTNPEHLHHVIQAGIYLSFVLSGINVTMAFSPA